MIYEQEVGNQVIIEPQQVATNATATGIVDCKDGNYLDVNFLLDKQANITNNPAVLKLQEADVTDASAFVDIPKFVGDGVEGFVIPDADTVKAQNIKMNVNLAERKRYIQAVLTPGGAAQQVAVLAGLSQGPDSTVQRALNTLVVE